MSDLTPDLAEKNVEAILEWLAIAHGKTSPELVGGLQLQLRTLRNTPLPTAQRVRLLDLLYGHTGQLTLSQLPALHEIALPAPRRQRMAARALQELLEALAQDYLNCLSELFDPLLEGTPRPPHTTLRRVMHCLSWHLTISNLVASPPGVGIWQQFHATFRTSRRLGPIMMEAPGEEGHIEQVYAATLLLAVAQPASFSSVELDFIARYVDTFPQAVGIVSKPPVGTNGVFWIDPDKDAPPQALSRRLPPPDAAIYFFASDPLAEHALDHLSALEKGASAESLGLPGFADTLAGRGVLRRLCTLWGNPAKRKFSRRRQSYRADLCAGLDQLWHLLKYPDDPPETSEWMVVNESPDGYALMHVSGNTAELRVGDIVAVCPHEGHGPSAPPWHVCIVRWAITENHAHIELGLQVLAPRGLPAELAQPRKKGGKRGTGAILLPATLPLRPMQALIVPTGSVSDPNSPFIVLVEKNNVEIREFRSTRLNEQTASIEVYTIEPSQQV